MGELAQLAGRRAQVDAYAAEAVEALVIPPDRLRALPMADAELGERIMRALILRRVGFLEAGADGPVIVGCADSGDDAGERQPLEISRPGVFAVGDVRSGSVKRVAAAVG